jgi:hypothetical protein
MIELDDTLTPQSLATRLDRVWELSAAKIESIQRTRTVGASAPVFTVNGKYTARGWTEWTLGFMVGSAVLQFDATGDERFLKLGRQQTVTEMAGHVTHFGVHDHGFNLISTHGNLLRLQLEGKLHAIEAEQKLHELALGSSGCVQARRWTNTCDGGGYIYSFNGPHSLFADTMRSLRSLAVAHRLGYALHDEHDQRISLLGRLIEHARSTARFNVYYGAQRDIYDVRGRVAHESIFNTNDGFYRCPSTQQGYSPFSTWTRGLAWVLLGYAEQLEFLKTVSDEELACHGGRDDIAGWMLRAATATADFYLAETPTCGVPYWDTGAPGLAKMNQPLQHPADPFNALEPVDSSAAAIAAQGLLRLGRYLGAAGEGRRYFQAGLTVLQTLLSDQYLSSDAEHQGLLLHSVYHRPNGWDHVPEGRQVPAGESSMWGDYHLRELVLYGQRLAGGGTYLSFFGPGA